MAVSGGIAAYKSVYLLRLLKSAGADVKVILTENAHQFVGELTFSALSDNPVYSKIIDNVVTGEWTNHVALAKWADAFVLAPATSASIAKIINGLADNLMVLVQMSCDCPQFIVPAMDLDMYASQVTTQNLDTLRQRNFKVIDAEDGFLASGLSGKGRMASEQRILNTIEDYFYTNNRLLKGKKVLINAGPTHEAIDPVRFIANRSTGKMGYALARAASAMGADVTLVSGPSHLPIPYGVKCIKVESAKQMFDACTEVYKNNDLAILSAAVADYTPNVVSENKIKKKTDVFSLELGKTQDILLHCGSNKQAHQTLVGFALESEKALEYGKGKLEKKNCNFIVVNSLQDAGAGFAHDSNKVTLLSKNNEVIDFPLLDKTALAFKLLEKIGEKIA